MTEGFVPPQQVSDHIHIVRGQKIILDFDLAALYGVPTKRLNEQVRRNLDRFPSDFMFQVTENEMEILRSQFATSSWGGRRVLPYAFTEHGVLMLSSVLNSERAIAVNIQIMRIYSKMRELLLTNKDILLKLEQMERKVDGHDENIQVIFAYLKKLLNPPVEPRPRIGFRRKGEQE
jgi:hypothetical protein